MNFRELMIWKNINSISFIGTYSSFYRRKFRKMSEILFDKNKCSGSSKAKCHIIVSSNTIHLFSYFPQVIIILKVNFNQENTSLSEAHSNEWPQEISSFETGYLFPCCQNSGDIICFRGKIEWLPLKLIHSALFLSLIMLFCSLITSLCPKYSKAKINPLNMYSLELCVVGYTVGTQ